MTITITPTAATLGAVVTGVDLAHLDDAIWHEIHAAFLAFGVLAFPVQHLDEASQGAFALRFGNVERLSPRRGQRTVRLHVRKLQRRTFLPG